MEGRRQEDSVLSKLLGNKPAFQWVLGRRDGTVPSGVVKYPDQIGNVYVCISKGQNNVWNVMPFFNGGPVTSGPVFKYLVGDQKNVCWRPIDLGGIRLPSQTILCDESGPFGNLYVGISEANGVGSVMYIPERRSWAIQFMHDPTVLTTKFFVLCKK